MNRQEVLYHSLLLQVGFLTEVLYHLSIFSISCEHFVVAMMAVTLARLKGSKNGK